MAAVSIWKRSSGTVTACTISGNVVSGDKSGNSNGGGIYIHYPAGPVTITDCVITVNSANRRGSGIFREGAADYTPVISNCLISNNTAGVYGGGIDTNSGLQITSCTIAGNKAVGFVNNYGNDEGGDGGINVNNGILLLTNTTITGNSNDVGTGGGLYLAYGTAGESQILDCTIVNNYTNSRGTNSGGLEICREGYAGEYYIPIVNTLIYNSASPDSIISGTSENARLSFFNCALPEELEFVSCWRSFDVVQIASWNNPVSSNETVNGVTHTLYKIEDNSALKSIVGAGANAITYTNNDYMSDLNYTSPETDQIGAARVNSPDIRALEKGLTVPVLS